MNKSRFCNSVLYGILRRASSMNGREMKSAYLKYIAALILFGSNGVIASGISLSSSEIVLFRSLIGSLFLIAVFVISRKPLMFLHAGKQSLYLIISGIAMGINWIFLFEAYAQIGVSVAILACYSGPILVMIAATFIFRERITLAKVIGLLSVIAGMICVNGLGILEGGFSWGLLCALIAALTYAIMVVFNKLASDITGLENTMWQLSISCIVIVVFTLFTQAGQIHVTAESIVPLFVLGLLNTGVGCYLYFSAIQLLPAQTVSIGGYLEPLSALVFSAIFLGERLGPLQLIGAVLILGGAAIGSLHPRKKSEHNSQAGAELTPVPVRH